MQVKVKAKKWFSAATADQSASATKLTITIGAQCYTLAATKKVD